ncbi:putative membrane protein [Wickerhamomyces ciferrii]|uniref:Membrane protein n=1 Tax=Wickerhamomyces ciferrii (strain ATCC 14091 / BCRC 22168 / CBS 111 / JCM 3599 / NBRC 0793 / NRRL Y-1031 F-60-10) TaxID=1206466 RepID=K0KMW4_WICCF|nr:uncharacterized protein BN7_2013 [Wickerhamomyces ciferrii]CCH42468.1 putative membrane protein [Wickerhamomyces ciferrii]
MTSTCAIDRSDAPYPDFVIDSYFHGKEGDSAVNYGKDGASVTTSNIDDNNDKDSRNFNIFSKEFLKEHDSFRHYIYASEFLTIVAIIAVFVLLIIILFTYEEGKAQTHIRNILYVISIIDTFLIQPVLMTNGRIKQNFGSGLYFFKRLFMKVSNVNYNEKIADELAIIALELV